MGCDEHYSRPEWCSVSRDAIVAAGTNSDALAVHFKGSGVPPNVYAKIDILREVTAYSCQFEGEVVFGGRQDEPLRGRRVTGQTRDPRGGSLIGFTSLEILAAEPILVAV